MFLHDNYLCLEDSNKDVVNISKRSDTIILESVKNGLMMVVYFSKRNRCHLHKKTVFTVPRKVRETRGAAGEGKVVWEFPCTQLRGRAMQVVRGICSPKDY